MRRFLGVAAVVAGWVAVALVTAWGALALAIAGPVSPPWLSRLLAGLWVVAVVATALLRRPLPHALPVLALLFGLLLAWYATLRPSNDRDWIEDVSRTPWGEVEGDRLVVHDVRFFDYRSETDWEPHWEDRTYDLSKLRSLDLFLSYWGPRDIAHTILSWGFEGGDQLAISIEIRKEKGEEYSALAGLFRQYEIFYVAADERDLVKLRTNRRGENVFLYRLSTPPDRARRLLLDYVATMNGLARRPRFYNAFSTNCTTSIRTHILKLGVAMPWDLRILRNGWIDQMLMERGAINGTMPYEELRRRSSIDDRAKAAESAPDFSVRIREGLPERPPPPVASVPGGGSPPMA